MAVTTQDTAHTAKHAAPEHGLVYRIVDAASFDYDGSDLDDLRRAQAIEYAGKHRRDQLRVKYSAGLGGWVVYDGPDFVAGCFHNRGQADAWVAARVAP